MGLAASSSVDESCEQPSDKHEATIYYFSGRGLADQIRWMLAASEISFTQKIISQRSQLLRMSTRQLPFGQLPLLQIDGIEIVQSQAAIRYLARRAGLQGRNDEEVLKCDMIVEAVRDLLGLVTDAPIKRVKSKRQRAKNNGQVASLPISGSSTVSNGVEAVPLRTGVAPGVPLETSKAESAPAAVPESPVIAAVDVWEEHLTLMKEKWEFYGARFEAIIRANHRSLTTASSGAPDSSSATQTSASTTSTTGAKNSTSNGITYDPSAQYFLVGDALTYADILVAHITTWFVEECGHEIVAKMPFLVHLQNQVISLPGIKTFIKSVHYFPLGDDAYVEQVSKVLGRNLLK